MPQLTAHQVAFAFREMTNRIQNAFPANHRVSCQILAEVLARMAELIHPPVNPSPPPPFPDPKFDRDQTATDLANALRSLGAQAKKRGFANVNFDDMGETMLLLAETIDPELPPPPFHKPPAPAPAMPNVPQAPVGRRIHIRNEDDFRTIMMPLPTCGLRLRGNDGGVYITHEDATNFANALRNAFRYIPDGKSGGRGYLDQLLVVLGYHEGPWGATPPSPEQEAFRAIAMWQEGQTLRMSKAAYESIPRPIRAPLGEGLIVCIGEGGRAVAVEFTDDVEF